VLQHLFKKTHNFFHQRVGWYEIAFTVYFHTFFIRTDKDSQ